MDKAILSELLIEFLKVDKATCPLCGHNLHGIEKDRCPACNIKLHLLIGSINLHLAPWITAFVGCSIGIGMWILVFFVFTMIAIEAGVVAGGSEMQLVLVTATLFFILGTGLVILFLLRLRFWRLNHIIQWMIAVGMITSYLASIVVAFQLIRGSWG